jgi:hypothetical protein
MPAARQEVAQRKLRWTAVTWAWCSIRTIPHRSHSIRKNHDGKAANGWANASSGVGSGSSV